MTTEIKTQNRDRPHTFLSLAKDVGGLFKGMMVTLRYFVNPKRVVTRQYPENRETLTFPERFRGQVVMPHDEQGETGAGGGEGNDLHQGHAEGDEHAYESDEIDAHAVGKGGQAMP